MKLKKMGSLGVLAVAMGVAGCSDCDEEIAAAGRFLSATENLQCKTDEDCAVVFTHCHTFEGGLCAQSPLSRTAANSSKWRDLAEDLDGCYEHGDEECVVCTAALLPACNEGLCSRSLN